MSDGAVGTPKRVDLSGRAAVVTGSSRGIGRAVIEALATAGARVVVNGRDEEAVRDTATTLREAGHEALAFAGDASDFDTAGRLVATCIDGFGAIDVLVNCAGVAEPPESSILDLDPADWQRLIDVHLSSVFYTCRHAAPHMKARGRGAIVNTSSHAALGHYGGTGYPAGKGGVNSLGFALAAELREHGVRVNTVCPGARTRLSSGPEYERHIERLHARGLISDGVRNASLAAPGPEHVAALYAFLASDAAAGVSGRLFSASGGYVGEFSPVAESLVAFRDVTASGAWPPDALAEAMHRHLRLSLRNAAPVEQRPPRADVITGHCLCEGVQFELREVVGPLELCHCPRCRRVSGSAFFAGLVVATDGYRMTAGRELVQSFALPVRERPPPYTTFFCMRCGSPVPHPEPEGETFELPAGLLEHDPGVSADRHIFIEHRAPWFDPNTALPEFDLAALIRLRFGRREADEPER